jgi:hypothetical protein
MLHTIQSTAEHAPIELVYFCNRCGIESKEPTCFAGAVRKDSQQRAQTCITCSQPVQATSHLRNVFAIFGVLLLPLFLLNGFKYKSSVLSPGILLGPLDSTTDLDTSRIRSFPDRAFVGIRGQPYQPRCRPMSLGREYPGCTVARPGVAAIHITNFLDDHKLRFKLPFSVVCAIRIGSVRIYGLCCAMFRTLVVIHLRKYGVQTQFVVVTYD